MTKKPNPQFIKAVFFLGTVETILQRATRKMRTHQELSTKPIKQLIALIRLSSRFEDLLHQRFTYRKTRVLRKKLQPYFYFRKTIYTRRYFWIDRENQVIVFQGKSYNLLDLKAAIEKLKDYEVRKSHIPEAEIDYDFSAKHRMYHQMVTCIRSFLIFYADNLALIYHDYGQYLSEEQRLELSRLYTKGAKK